MFIDGAKIVDDHLPLIRKLVWDFIKRQGEGVSYEELMPVAYEAARQAWETFDPGRGCVYATHCRRRIRHALLDYVGDRNRVVKDMEITEKRYARAWGDPDAKPRGRTKKTRPLVEAVSYENGNRVTRYATGPYRSSPQLIRGLGAVTSKHNKVGFTPIQTQFGDGWHKPSDGTSWRRALVEDEGNQGVTDPRLVLWAGEKEFKGKEKAAPADYSDWQKIWNANYQKHCSPSERRNEVRVDIPVGVRSYVRDDGDQMVEVGDHRFVSAGYVGVLIAVATRRDVQIAVVYTPAARSTRSATATAWLRLRGHHDLADWAAKGESSSRWIDFLNDPRPHLMKLATDPFVAPPWPQPFTWGAARPVAEAVPWTPGNRRRELRGARLFDEWPLALFLPKARIAYDKGRADRKWVTELVADGKRLRAREIRAAAEVNAVWKWPNPQQLAKLRAERPTWWTGDEIKNQAERWVTVSGGDNISTTVPKKSLLGRYNKQEENSTTVPRPPVLAPALLGGSQSDRRASLNDRLTFVSQQLDLLNRGVALRQERVDAMIRPNHSNDESHRRERPY
jgi:hypothetical protein